MKIKTPSEALCVGMFVYELDRPWLDTPFVFQGFLIEKQAQIDDLRLYCRFVFVDPARSTVPVMVGVNASSKVSTIPAKPPEAVESERSILELEDSEASPLTPTSRLLAKLRTHYPPLALVEDELPAAKQALDRTTEAVRSILEGVVSKGILDSKSLHESIEEVTESVIRNPDALLLLSYLRRKSKYAYDHALSVSIHLLAFGRHMGLPKKQMQILGEAGLLLDVGMGRLPEGILEKKGNLSSEEYEAMKEHVQFSLEIIHSNPGFSPQTAEIIAQHHERENGSGYPLGLKERQITLLGKMAAIVDCFVALISERPYADSISPLDALQRLYNWRKDYYHEDMVEQFIQCLGPYPVGSFVELNTGEVAIVLAHNRIRRLKPKVMAVLDADKKAYASPIMLDLINNPLTCNAQPYEIKRSLPGGVYEVDLKEFYH
ncbi:MAG: HD-GYP domain-containing protein [Sulfurimicrobium sp.]|nr:HD-GYP domain-containing protein [Sulfurimicrobium sp.]MDO9188542.1 HD-GYP domain-containing protein [Sulfurimicrobium sp.]MDP1703305.1 HD-GYP domain-containing protein [Sulfurimicrobium sp.]MDP2200106.1 HD-GYP domain-containing protein [Sulfurimicrobium sp.]MDP3687456.1 HD-GYP domain-containing protein [Sulfurimicrobium sp.]